MPRYGLVVQLVRTLACHARGRGFEPHPGRHHAVIAQLAEHFLGKEEVTRSNRVNSSILVRMQKRLGDKRFCIFANVSNPCGNAVTSPHGYR